MPYRKFSELKYKKAYEVTWLKEDVEANSPEEAAKICRELLMDPENTASIFEVKLYTGGRVGHTECEDYGEIDVLEYYPNKPTTGE